MSQLKDIEAAWIESASAAVVSHATAHPSELFYAGSLWLCYVDYRMFGVPCFALNIKSQISQMGEDLRWSPADWQFPCIDSTVETMQPYYSALTKQLAARDKAYWDQIIKDHYACLARVCRRITHDARSRLGVFSDVRLSDDFVVGIFEFREAEPLFTELVRASIEPQMLSSLPHQVWEPS